ncbi:MAG: zinc ribbon domain-containing protein [Peptococcaceae bacterium]|nr:zinc ribbon domain-containing protein [Peptococcaceae bacterium]
MFFMIGVTPGEKQLDFRQPILCRRCGKYGRFEVYVTYMQLLLFFLPVFRWNRRYLVRTSCCGACYELRPETGRQIEKGLAPEIQPQDLGEAMTAGFYPGEEEEQAGPPAGPPADGPATPKEGQEGGSRKRCAACGFTTDQDYAYCPKCGRLLK